MLLLPAVQGHTAVLVGIKAEMGKPRPAQPTEGYLEFFVDWCVEKRLNIHTERCVHAGVVALSLRYRNSLCMVYGACHIYGRGRDTHQGVQHVIYGTHLWLRRDVCLGN